MYKMDAMQTPQPKVSFKEQMHQAREDAILQSACRLLGEKAFDAMTTVSYTHLTLPTILLV